MREIKFRAWDKRFNKWEDDALNIGDDELRASILKAARCTIAPKDPEVVRNKVIVEIPIDELMALFNSEVERRVRERDEHRLKRYEALHPSVVHPFYLEVLNSLTSEKSNEAEELRDE